MRKKKHKMFIRLSYYIIDRKKGFFFFFFYFFHLSVVLTMNCFTFISSDIIISFINITIECSSSG